MKKGTLALVIIVSICAGAIAGAYLFRGESAGKLKDKVKVYEDIIGNLHRENDSLLVDRKRRNAQNQQYRYQLDTLERSYTMALSALSFNTTQLSLITAKYEQVTGRRYDTLSSAGIRRYFADSLQLP